MMSVAWHILCVAQFLLVVNYGHVFADVDGDGALIAEVPEFHDWLNTFGILMDEKTPEYHMRKVWMLNIYKCR